jgi:regulator of ribosome biosynthesis
MALIKQLGSGPSKKAKRDTGGDGGGDDGNVLNVRKAVRFASDGKGAIALARKSARGAERSQKRKGKR